MRKLISIDSYDVTRQMKTISDANPNVETAIAGGGKVIDGTRIFLQHVLEYNGASKQEGQVSISADSQAHTHEKLAEKGYDAVAQGHQHLEKYDHAHDFSEQDEKTIENQHQPVHLLLYKTEDSVRVKAVDTDMNPVPFVVKGVTMDIINIFDNKVEEYKEAA